MSRNWRERRFTFSDRGGSRLKPKIRFQRASLADCHTASGLVVVIDVIRAFTTAAFALQAGAQEIWLVRDVEEAFALRKQHPHALLMGEFGGLPIPGFDFGNSPSLLEGAVLQGRLLIHRTGHGTAGVVLSESAEHILASSLVNARATAQAIRSLQPDQVTFVITGAADKTPDSPGGAEDWACADYLQVLLQDRDPDPQPFLDRVRFSEAGQILTDPNQPEFPAEDLACALEVNRFDFAMPVTREDGHLVLRARRMER